MLPHLRAATPVSAVSGEYLESTYKPLADDWKIYASGGETLELLDWGPR